MRNAMKNKYTGKHEDLAHDLSQSSATTRRDVSTLTHSSEQRFNHSSSNNNDDADDDTAAEERVVPIIDAILSPDRISSLFAGDTHVMTYDPTSFLIVFRWRGRNLSMIAQPLLYLLLSDIIWAILLPDYLKGFRDKIVLVEELVTPLLTPVSFLLVFRLGRAAVRFWESRTALGQLVATSRLLISTAAVACSTRTDLIDEFARWTCVFPITVKNFLRPDTWRGHVMNSRSEIGNLLSNEEAKEALHTNEENYGPILVLNRLRDCAYRASFDESSTRTMNMNSTLGGGGGQEPKIDSLQGIVLEQTLNRHIDALTEAWGAMERINSTPLPFIYVVHLRTFLILYLVLWNLLGVATSGWTALLPLLVSSWALLGIEATAIECERPFKWRSNHLPLGKMCVIVSRNVAQTLNNVRRGVTRKERSTSNNQTFKN